MRNLDPGGFTPADLAALPDDGRRYELVDGQLLVTPAPQFIHQRAVVRLTTLLESSCPDGLEVLVAPFDFRPTSGRCLQPDVLVRQSEDVARSSVTRLQLAVEVLSPSTRSVDLLLKRGLYEQAGVESYWLFDPEQEELTVLELVDGSYVEWAVVQGAKEFSTQRPFDVRVVPADLVRRSHRQAV
ncbi:Uma2 family endonuclease [Kribbella amoyensis]|uniref:Uma2 family endonuclease n=1 Tax=Kribbella amoyensis TaxID=996641 RepID=A0A561B735_9ACTN|nr:Uma2 family endonuclease [Kribbella amoyensis]TWD74784.1 Uma2 family endonuclease [Kribbella amoyensis]